MEKTKKYINTLSCAIDLIIRCAKSKQHGISFAEVEKAVNGLDIADIINEEPDNTLTKWIEVSGNTPSELKARWDGGQGMVAEYIKASEQRADEFFRNGKRPQPKHLKETTEAIDRALQRLLKWQELHEKENAGQTTAPTTRREQKRLSVDISKKKATTIFERLKADGYIARETMLADWLSALGIDNNEFKKIRWTKKQTRNKDTLSIRSLIDFLFLLNLNINKIKDVVGDVFDLNITSDIYTKFQETYKSEFHDELKKILS